MRIKQSLETCKRPCRKTEQRLQIIRMPCMRTEQRLETGWRPCRRQEGPEGRQEKLRDLFQGRSEEAVQT